MKSADYTTSAKKKRYVETECQRMLNTIEAINPDIRSFLDGSFGLRRQKAVFHYLERAQKDFQNFGVQSIVESFTRSELSPFNNYNHLDEECDLRIGAALWILDRLRATGKLMEAYKILPDTTGEVEAFCLPPDFHHPCFDNDLIHSVIYVITRRYTGKTDRNYSVLTEENARGKPAAQEYTALLQLLPENDVKVASEAFKEKLWDLAARRMRGQAYYDKEVDRITGQLQNVAPLMAAPIAKSPVMSDPMRGVFPGMGILPGIDDPDRIDVVRRYEELLEKKNKFEIRFDQYLQMDRRQIRRETGSREVADALDGFTVDDPYALCFALFYLIDSGDDAPWLIASGSSLMLFVLRMLPWYAEQEGWDDDDWDAWFDGLRYDQNGWIESEAPPEQVDFYHEKFNGKNLAQVIYGLCRGIVPVGLHPFEAERQQMITEGMEEEKANRVTQIAEMLFLHSFQATQYRPIEWDEPMEEGAETSLSARRAELDERIELDKTVESAAHAIPVKLGGYWGRVAEKQGFEAPVPVSEDIVDLKAELEQLKKQLKGLRAALSNEKRAADSDRAKYERELKTLRMEHRELADLRTLVFNSNAEDQRQVEKTEKQIAYPYETKKRTVIFGGHDTWLKSIKPMLPDVKFVDADNLAFNPDIVRNSDVVWIQNNCISHTQFWTVVKYCKLADVQMRYFGFSSAEKCAEQLVTEDQKRG